MSSAGSEELMAGITTLALRRIANSVPIGRENAQVLLDAADCIQALCAELDDANANLRKLERPSHPTPPTKAVP